MSADTPPVEGPRLTAEQGRPVQARGVSVALSAGAGCGKTTVLTSRFLGELEEHGADALRSVVAVTFTQKAARELRQRIRDACHKRLGRSDESAPAWREVLRGLGAAPISTFHEFCGGLLRRHAVAAGVDPDFQVLDAPIAASLMDEAISRGLRDRLALKDEDLIELGVDYGLPAVKDAVEQLVRHREAARLGEWAERDEREYLDRWRAFRDENIRPRLRRRLLEAGRACADFWRAEEFAHKTLARKRDELLADLSDLPARVDDLGWASELRGKADSPRGVKATDWPSPAVHQGALGTLRSIRAEIDRWVNADADDEEHSLRAATVGRRFARLGSQLRGEYEAAKRRRGGLDFDDLLVKARDLLRDDPSVREAESAASRFVLVDEFQDTDPVQSEILRLLAGDDFGSGRLFVVGDFKQSIYRFRGARPRLFHEYRDAFPPSGRMELTENFRSVPGVIDFVNALFHGAFEGETARLVPGPGAGPTSDAPAVEFVWPVDDEPAPEGSASRKTSKTTNLRAVEARWLARLVRDKLRKGWPVRDRRTGARRNAHAGDVAFLFRAMTDVGSYERALADEGLDFYVVGGSAFYAQQEVVDLVNVLSVIEDPFDGIALAGALRGPFFGVSDGGLFWLGDRGGLAERFLDAEAPEGLSATDRVRCDRARGLLAQWRTLKDRVPMGDLVDRVLDESGYEAALLGEFLGDRKRANARKLVRSAREFDARGGFTLGHFVAHLRSELGNAAKEEQASTTDEDGGAVRLLSIHQSKGLEFPIVVVPDLNRMAQSRSDLVAFDPATGPLVRNVEDDDPTNRKVDKAQDKSLGRRAFEEVERMEEAEESVRLLYVATTRARDALVLSAAVGSERKPVGPALKRIEECFDRETGACKVALPDGWPSPRVGVIAACPPALPAAGKRETFSAGALARVILSARPSPRPRPSSNDPGPRLLDLDELRAGGPLVKSQIALMRSTFAGLESAGPGGVAEAVRLASRRLSPRPPRSVVDDVSRWLERPLEALSDHATAVLPGAPWMTEWPPEGTSPTVILGSSDLIVRDGEGVWGVVTFSPPDAPEFVERLRWMLSARAAARLALGPIGPGRRIILGEPGRIVVEEPAGPGAISAALGAVLSVIKRAGRQG